MKGMANAEDIIRALNDAGIGSFDLDENFDGTIRLEIHNGDWKHSHLYADEILGELGYAKDGESVTESFGEDFYSSIHSYSKIS